jgi:uridine kinase
MKTKYSVAILIRLIIIFTILPSYLGDYFVPFLNNLTFDSDIWSLWLDSGGDDRAFPYGIAMLIAYVPSLALSQFLQLLTLDPIRALEIAVGLQMLTVEGLIWRHLEKSESMKKSINFFLFSPLIIWVNYCLGLNDFFPSACLFFASYLLLSHRYRYAGIWIGLAIGMKFSLALVLPFLILFAWDNPRFKKNIWLTAFIAFGVGLIMYLPGIYSADFRDIVFNNKESMKSLGYFLNFGENKLFILPLIYLLLLYWLWRAGRISIEVLVAFFGISLILISALSPASIGWMLWGLPLIFINLAQEKKTRLYLVLIQTMFIAHNVSSGIEIRTVFGETNTPALKAEVRDLLFTFATVLVVIWSYSSLKVAIRLGDCYKIAKAPLTVSIAGDSGTGKDTLAKALKDMFTPETASIICGDDYHKYEREDDSWEKTTHLNPNANYLDLWENDYKLAYRREYFEQREYNHETGKFSQLKPRLSRDFLISQGLHSLYPNLTEFSDLRVYLSMDDELRIHLKLNRDHTSRGQTYQSILSSIKKRDSDYHLFIAPQKLNADIHFHLFRDNGNISLRILAKGNATLDDFMNQIEKYPEINVKKSHSFNENIYEIISSNDNQNVLQEILKRKLSAFDQLFLIEPRLPGGCLGIMTTLTIIMVTNKRQASNVQTN